MKKQILKSFMLIAALAIMATSCNKTDETALTSDEIAQMQADNYEDAMADEIDQSTDDIVYEMDAAGYNKSGLKSATCYTVTVDKQDTTVFPKTITIDYGAGCSVVVNGDTITRKGSITIVVTGRYFQAGSTRTTTFNNFFINNTQFEGTRIITSVGKDAQNNFSWNYEVKNGKMTFPDGKFSTRESNMTRTRMTNNTAVRADDYVTISGAVQGVNTKGEAYNREITTQLRKNFGCRFFVSGVVEITRNDKSLTIDYGTGTCDRLATLTKDGESSEIRLRWGNN